MPDKVQAVPEGFHTITAHITVRDAARAIDFYQKAFGAEVRGVSRGPDGKIMHASLKIGDSILMLNDELSGVGHVVAAIDRWRRGDAQSVPRQCGRGL